MGEPETPQHGIGCIVIAGDDDKIAGIMSERDLMQAISQGGPKVLNEPVSNFMTKTVVTAGEADTSDPLKWRFPLFISSSAPCPSR